MAGTPVTVGVGLRRSPTIGMLGKGSGVEVNLRVYPHWKVRDGRVFYSFEYPDRASALEAAGLSE